MTSYSKKAILLGLGLFELTRERAEALVDELVKKGEIAANERAAYLNELVTAAAEKEQRLVDQVKTAVRDIIADLGIARADDLTEIKERLARIEARLSDNGDQHTA